MKRPHAREYSCSWLLLIEIGGNHLYESESHLEPWYLRRYMWAAKGMYSSIMSRSATAIPVRIRLIGFRRMSLDTKPTIK